MPARARARPVLPSSPQPLDEWEDCLFEILLAHRPDVLVHDHAILADHEGLGDTIDAPLDTDSPVEVGAGPGIGIAEVIEPFRGVLGPVLVVEAVDRDDAVLLELHE